MTDSPSAAEVVRTGCCVAGGGPAGMMLGLLLARAGVDVVVIEKHRDFLRDFRGDTIHPSTLEVMHELGLLDEFLRLPHQEVRQLMGVIGDTSIRIADFSHLPTRCRFIALMPQWDFLNFLAEKAGRYPGFRLRMQAEATDLIEDGGRVTGLRATTPAGTFVVQADLVVGADGRHSTVRRCAGLDVEDIGAPIDVLWMRLPRRPSDGTAPLGRFGAGKIFIMLDRGDYWQCAYVIRKGGFDEVKAKGLDAFRAAVAEIAPPFADRVRELGELGRHQAAHRQDRPAADLAPFRPPLHRRRGARDVAGRRRRHQSRGPGRGGGGQHPGGAAARRHAARAGPCRRAAPAQFPDPGDATNAGVHAEQSAWSGPGQPTGAVAAMAVAADQSLALAAADSGAAGRDGISARARARCRRSMRDRGQVVHGGRPSRQCALAAVQKPV